jgi:hypothetical protein
MLAPFVVRGMKPVHDEIRGCLPRGARAQRSIGYGAGHALPHPGHAYGIPGPIRGLASLLQAIDRDSRLEPWASALHVRAAGVVCVRWRDEHLPRGQ